MCLPIMRPRAASTSPASGLSGHYEGHNDKGEDVVLENTRQLEAGEVLDLAEDIQPNYDFFKDGPGYTTLQSYVASEVSALSRP